MAGQIVYTDVAEGANLGGQLFAGKKFWVAQRVPTRPRYLELIRSNGGEVVLLEKRADYLIADHLHRNCPLGSLSYTFILRSLENGELADPEAYRAGPAAGSVREVGSISRPTKVGRAVYTADEDRILYKWVRDHERQGGSASGNQIYKQLEVKHPRHTWQSWRDRYLKTLRNRAPAGLNVPENAPPSPPSDQSAERIPPARPVPKKDKQPAQTRPATQGERSRVSAETKVPPSVDAYTIDDFEKIFGTEDWEELYANAKIIQEIGVKDYIEAWQSWAKGTPNTAEQWRQYFEKVVLPQWLQDESPKKRGIESRVAKRHGRGPEAGEDVEEEGENGDVKETSAKIPSAAGPSTQTPKRKREQSATRRYELQKMPLPSSAARSSTITQNTPDYIRNAHEKIMKRIFDGDQFNEMPEESQPPKKQKLDHALRETEGEKHKSPGTQNQPVESSSEASSQELGATAEEQAQAGGMEDEVEDDDVDAQNITHSVEEVQYPDLERLATPTGNVELEPPSSSNFPSNTPTPRAPRQRSNAFDTQAILSSPSQSQAFHFAPLPRPAELRDASHDPASLSSDLGHQDSEASTTHSLQEFRRSLNADEDDPSSLPQGVAPLPRPARELSLTPSDTDSNDSGDPDPPLDPAELDEFFEEQKAQGFSDEEITAALRHTRCRPELAIMVLEAWKENGPLPDTRGVWSREDDGNVEGGDGVVLARLGVKHSMEGWGGVTERLRFLDMWRGGER
ncbi:hypothetical protein K491DRAFT_659496 [Lophiostoma macrostomum CBS 122681]|uniref:DNA-binding protein RAP1 n=1 Tax=Lophiostoma macrostomum CBS 122681 TaxID=1314788 RepID=A0A6A6T8F7_9PLEO|nr:hypothetical protein K491DRAFT_659496 [Lophiostoma macrostomum CBS 122681]